MVDVFISYSRTDLAKVTQLAQMVEAEGYDVWWDADLPPHLSYGDVITAKIGMAKAAIVVWSQASAASEWVRAEADMARNQKKLVQTALDNVMPPLPFNQIQYAEIGDWRGEPDHPGWRKVKVSLAELCGREPVAAPRPERPEAVQHHVAPPVSVAPKASNVPLIAGSVIGAGALLVAGWALWRDAYAEGEVAEEERLVERASPAPVQEPAAPAQVAAPAEVIAPVAEPAPAPPPPVAASADFAQGAIIADSSTRRLTRVDIAGLGPIQLRLARNEIYARHGRRFNDPDLADYFGRQSWYRPVADEVDLSELELANVALLRRAEVGRMAGATR